ncbi:hypothetical protein GH714_036964 [Hevea brasiliensis]|uniref:HAT C-terminal dimerisation domain-containing protein n=1 Tax=Hevea brasiliensis TaxID=3981 RepID=A0A6A6L4A1_HEVBR|nr:hypothetical protein GH714_036964 [Hevea brasiliensis]
MLEVAKNFKEPFTYDEQDPYFKIDLMEEDGSNGIPNNDDWANVRRMVTLLQQFYELTLRVSESAFSTRGRVLDSFKSSLSPKIAEALICSQDWLRVASKPINIEEELEKLEKLDIALSNVVLDSTMGN